MQARLSVKGSWHLLMCTLYPVWHTNALTPFGDVKCYADFCHSMCLTHVCVVHESPKCNKNWCNIGHWCFWTSSHQGISFVGQPSAPSTTGVKASHVDDESIAVSSDPWILGSFHSRIDETDKERSSMFVTSILVFAGVSGSSTWCSHDPWMPDVWGSLLQWLVSSSWTGQLEILGIFDWKWTMGGDRNG